MPDIEVPQTGVETVEAVRGIVAAVLFVEGLDELLACLLHDGAAPRHEGVGCCLRHERGAVGERLEVVLGGQEIGGEGARAGLQ